MKPVIGYRTWKVRSSDQPHNVSPYGGGPLIQDYTKVKLQSVFMGKGDTWYDVDLAEAECSGMNYPLYMPKSLTNVKPADPPVPHDGHSCGLWAHNTPERMMAFKARKEYIGGAVIAWGKVLAAPFGMKAQFMRVLCILDEEFNGKFHASLVAETLGLPLVSLDQLENYAMEFGEPLPYIEPE